MKVDYPFNTILTGRSIYDMTYMLRTIEGPIDIICNWWIIHNIFSKIITQYLNTSQSLF